MSLRHDIAADLRAYEGRATLGGLVRSLLFSGGFLALFMYRLCRGSRRLWICRKVPLLRLIPAFFIRFGQLATGCEINPAADIEAGVKIHHASGIVIGICTIRRGAQLFQGVTLGADGVSARSTERYPTVGRGATLFAGAKIIGNVTIGDRAIVGANAVLNRSIPEGAVAVGVPARVIRIDPAPGGDTLEV